MIGRIIVSSVAGGIVFFLLGFLLYGIVFKEFMTASTYQYDGLLREPGDINMIALAASNIAWAALISIVVEKWPGVRSLAGGAGVGAVVMFFAAAAIDLQFAAFMNFYKNFTPFALDIVLVTVMGAAAGSVIGIVSGQMSKTGAEASA